MACNCKGKNEGNDLKFFIMLTQTTQELLNRSTNKITLDMTMETKVQTYRRLLQVLQKIDKAVGGKLSK